MDGVHLGLGEVNELFELLVCFLVRSEQNQTTRILVSKPFRTFPPAAAAAAAAARGSTYGARAHY